MKPTRVVPCEGCQACCKREAVILHPECGDDPAAYRTVAMRHPFTGQPTVRLEQKPNGDCFYLGMHGCSIWERRPAICREFDCRLAFLRISRPTRKKMLRAGTLDQATVDAGRARLHTLTIGERDAAMSGARI